MQIKGVFGYEALPKDVQKKLKCYTFKKIVNVTCNKPISGLQTWQNRPCAMGERYYKFAEAIRNFQVRDNDVWIISYPKCGTTWTQEMVWMLGNNLDYETGSKVDLSDRSPFFEMAPFVPFNNSLKTLDKMRGQRFIKSHLPANLLPIALWTSKARIVYVARNPKDAAISNFHHHKGIYGYTGTFNDYLEGFLDGNLIYGSYYDHVYEFMELAKKCPNIYFNTYEDMKYDMMRVLRDVSEFLGKKYSDEQLKKLDNHLKFDNMKNVKTSNMSLTTKYAALSRGKLKNKFVFMRKGEVGSFKSEMPEQFIDRFDEMSARWNNVHNFHEKWIYQITKL